MKLIPVIDLQHGRVVHARQGERARYREMQSALCRSSAPEAVADALLGLFPFPALYIADLDAIQGGAANYASIERIARRHGAVQLWIDAGFPHAEALERFAARGLGMAVLGSESIAAAADLESACAAAPVLSLDFRADRFVGPAALMAHPEHWPPQVVVMSLARVGGNLGPDFDRLRAVRMLRPDVALYAAGGVQGADDLSELESIGLQGALLASALHDGRLSAGCLARYV